MCLLTAEITVLSLSWSGVSPHLAHLVLLLGFAISFFRVLIIDSSDNIHAQQRILVQVKTKGSIN